MGREKVTTCILRGMAMGETRTFDLPTDRAVNCGKSIAYRLQHELKCKFSAVSDYANHRLTITKLSKPPAGEDDNDQEPKRKVEKSYVHQG